MPRPSVLISGASVTGTTLAHWLGRYGFATTVVERFDQLREEGHNVDVRGAGREVLRRMGLEDAALAENTGETGTVFVDDDGAPIASFAASTDDTTGATAELEILRGRLAGLIHDTTTADTEYLFGDRIADLQDTADGVEVTFASGATRRFDLVLVAEGVNSRTRRFVSGAPARRYLGMYCAYLTIPRTAEDDDTWRWYNALGGRSVNLRPDNVGTTRALLNFLSDTRGIDQLDRDGQVTILRRVFADAGWAAPRVLAALDDAPFYFEDLAQVHLDRWSRGRVALAGDAAHCASPVSGMGTTLGVTGAYVLATEIARATRGDTVDHRAAFDRYEEILRPYVAKAQKLPPGVPGVANPRTRRGRALFRTALRVAASAPARKIGSLGGRYFTPPADDFVLPDVVTGRLASAAG
ncbi:FAD-dependent monooxygenase [Nakamurella flavida]|uniref:FAD-dependent monooxygenase n=1 Tax=Nakamurella flavida TaxID=363630 RepID=A0A938YM74_9ACTN|nr:FAD-dependent monooxygenase [Nakamurella flavida]MBM9475804.1 FAD-dependent monooxygenase [Nakamurella flavida]MDP9777914.1 2-polyprenyl-6-methoxyphenol hydroxylase-like FAD-dependent oxidoreductase [Nakamurella flavida]